jgi:ADP-ribose pyrophosphatase YjhB (NUDIX family)
MMKNTSGTQRHDGAAAQSMAVHAVPGDFVPTREHIDALARRMMPEIKRFFADEQIQREFAEWMAQQQSAGDLICTFDAVGRKP